jgi:hypothetical protein
LYFNGTHPALDLGTDQVDMQEAVIEPGTVHFDTFGENKGTLELTRRDAAVKVDALRVVGLLAPDDELVVLDRYAEVAHQEASHREGNPQGVLPELLDIVGRIYV